MSEHDLFQRANAADKPNIVLILADDLGYNDIGAFGCPVDDITPNIDRLASEGVRFEHAHVTVAICQPIINSARPSMVAEMITTKSVACV